MWGEMKTSLSLAEQSQGCPEISVWMMSQPWPMPESCWECQEEEDIQDCGRINYRHLLHGHLKLWKKVEQET